MTEPDRFFYHGKLMLNEMYEGRINDIAWAPYPRKFAEGAHDVIAVTGQGGTCIFRRMPLQGQPSRLQSMNEKWEVVCHHKDLKGSMCCWNLNTKESGNYESGHLLVAIGSTNLQSGKAYVLNYSRNGGPPVKKCIYDASTAGIGNNWLTNLSREIICMCYDFDDIIIFTSQSRSFLSLRWIKSTVWEWKQAEINFDNSSLLYNLIGCSSSSDTSDELRIAVSNSKTIKVYEWEENNDTQWKLICLHTMGPDTPMILCMSFNMYGKTLAILSQDRSVTLFELRPVRNTRRLHATHPLDDPANHPAYPFKLYVKYVLEGQVQMCFSIKRNFLMISGGDFNSVQVLSLDNYELYPKVMKGPLGAVPFNGVTRLISCPSRGKVFAFMGIYPNIHFWGDGTLLPKTERNFFWEKFHDHEETPPADACAVLEKMSSKCLGVSTECKELSDMYKTLKESYVSVGGTLERSLNTVLGGQPVNVSMLEKIYSAGKFTKKKLKINLQDDDDLTEVTSGNSVGQGDNLTEDSSTASGNSPGQETDTQNIETDEAEQAVHSSVDVEVGHEQNLSLPDDADPSTILENLSNTCIEASKMCKEVSKIYNTLLSKYTTVGERLGIAMNSAYGGEQIMKETLEDIYIAGKFTQAKPKNTDSTKVADTDDTVEFETLAGSSGNSKRRKVSGTAGHSGQSDPL